MSLSYFILFPLTHGRNILKFERAKIASDVGPVGGSVVARGLRHLSGILLLK